MTDQQRPASGPGDEQDAPVTAPVAADEPTRPLSRPAPPAEQPAAASDQPAAVPDQAGTKAEAPAADPGDEPTAVATGVDDGETVRLTPPPDGGPATVAHPPRPDEEPTTRLQPQPRATPGDAPTAAGPTTTGDAPAVDDAPQAGATASPEAVIPAPAGDRAPGGDPDAVPPETYPKPAPWQRLSSAGALIWVLLALFGFTLVVQLRSNDTDQGLAGARQDDLVRILSDLEARDTRLQAEINALEGSRQQLTSGVAGREAALAEADKRADELGLLAGTLPGRGPGLVIRIDRVKASEILNAVQELRGAGGEVMQVGGAGGGVVRIVASTYFVDAEGGGIVVDGTRLSGPYTLTVIGVPQTMQTALEIPGGVVASVQSDGGSVTMEQRTSVEVTAVRKATSLQYARPVS